MWIERPSAGLLKRLAETRPAVLVTGARQTGKTALLQHIFPSHRFVSLDLPSEAEQAERDPETFLRRHGTPIILDEAQYAPKLFRHLKIAIDRDRGANGRYLLSGSQKQQLMQRSSESLAGRVGIMELETLSDREVLTSGSALALNVRIVRGGYPELCAKPEVDAISFYQSYVATYLERDVRSMLAVSSLRDFERFVRSCALRSGQLLNKSDLARDVGISPSTAGVWLSVLQASNVIVLLEPWFGNRTKSLVKSPKLYMADSGLLCHLVGIRSESDLVASPLAGAIWESFVFGEMRKLQEHQHGYWACNFWSDRLHELDFVMNAGGRFTLFDAKLTSHPDSSDTKQLAYAARELGAANVGRCYIVCQTPNAYPVNEQVQAISVGDLFSANE